MANHAYITTQKHMTKEKVRAVLDKLNRDIFFDCLEIEDSIYDDKHGWYIHVKGENEYQTRICWLNSRRHFEIRHGGGSDFLWWVDMRIQDEISKVFIGRVKDDGGAGYDEILTTWDMPDSYPEYINRAFGRLRDNSDMDFIGHIYMFTMRWKLRGYPKSYKQAYKQAKKNSRADCT